MIAYDILMLVVVVGYTIFGAVKGMAWQVATLCSIVVSYFAALKFSDPLAPLLSKEAPWNRFLAMLIIFLVTSLVIWFIFRAVSKFIERVKLKDFDRQVGALFGLFKGALACVAITFFAVTLSQAAREAVLKSQSGYYIAVLLNKADPVMPEQLHELLGPYVHQLQEKLNQPNPHATPVRDGRAEAPAGGASPAPGSTAGAGQGGIGPSDLARLRAIVADLEKSELDEDGLRWVRENIARLEALAAESPTASGTVADTDWTERAARLVRESEKLRGLIEEVRRTSEPGRR
ncbi:MAG: CvpA family protein [Planctomycetia bacterium]|nr:CvpA family protein [Planctomycetia bacterium]